ncbi:MAG: metallophosphoesterase [Lentisphaerae bacterium]|nr:metallophosphoesterase [Lentisphaerota bacterium]
MTQSNSTAITRSEGRPFRLWAFGDAHVGTDLKQKRESLADAIRQSEGGVEGYPAFDWDIALDVGDMSGGQAVPDDAEGREVVRQLGVLKQHPREAVYTLCGNHDRSGLKEEPAWWWRKWLDPLGEHTEFSCVTAGRRPFPIEGTWERYAFRIGNLLFLIMSDINEPTQKKGRGELGGNPGGVVSGETFAWWKSMVESNRDFIIVTAHHYLLKNTTTATGEYEGFRKNAKGEWVSHYHGYKPEGSPKGASYLYFVDSKPDAQAFENYLEAHPGAIALWLGGHTHTVPDDTAGGKPMIAARWGVQFINVCALSKFHRNAGLKTAPMSRLLTFTPGQDQVRVQCYMHNADVKAPGWHAAAEKTLPLGKAFRGWDKKQQNQ